MTAGTAAIAWAEFTNQGTGGSSDGIQLAEAAATISNAKEREDAGSVGLANKIVTAAFSGSFYIEEADRFSGILVLGPPPPIRGAYRLRSSSPEDTWTALTSMPTRRV